MTNLADEIERLAKEATPGEWRAVAGHDPRFWYIQATDVIGSPFDVPDTEHNALPQIISALRGEQDKTEGEPVACPDREAVASFQQRVGAWMLECFGPVIPFDKVERNDRFIEEALELTQATGYSAERAHALVDYVFGRPIGEPSQEVGGVMVTLAALCNVHGLDFTAAGLRELDRIEQPAIMAKIKAKQAAKPTGSALPSALSASGGGE